MSRCDHDGSYKQHKPKFLQEPFRPCRLSPSFETTEGILPVSSAKDLDVEPQVPATKIRWPNGQAPPRTLKHTSLSGAPRFHGGCGRREASQDFT